MMGNRGSADGTERDAFSQRSRRVLSWCPGELRRIKRQFSKRTRRAARLEAAQEAKGV